MNAIVSYRFLPPIGFSILGLRGNINSASCLRSSLRKIFAWIVFLPKETALPLFRIGLIIAVAVAGMASSAAASERLPLDDFLGQLNFAPIAIEGEIYYSASLNDGFTLISPSGDYFPVIMDSGRADREAVEQGCGQTSALLRSPLCHIEAMGSVEIRGSSIHLSIDEVVRLTIPERNP